MTDHDRKCADAITALFNGDLSHGKSIAEILARHRSEREREMEAALAAKDRALKGIFATLNMGLAFPERLPWTELVRLKNSAAAALSPDAANGLLAELAGLRAFAEHVKAFWLEAYQDNADMLDPDAKWGDEELEREVDAALSRTPAAHLAAVEQRVWERAIEIADKIAMRNQNLSDHTGGMDLMFRGFGASEVAQALRAEAQKEQPNA